MENVFLNFLLTQGLYETINITGNNFEDLISLLRGNLKIDLYCKTCGEKRVFTMSPATYSYRHGDAICAVCIADLIKSERQRVLVNNLALPNIGEDLSLSTPKKQPQNLTGVNSARVIVVNFECAFNPAHHLEYIILIENDVLMKVGQFPSVADLSLPELKQYNKVMAPENMKELRRAIGLFAQGIGIGSYVYLRRIVEQLIDDAKEKAISEGVLTAEDYRKEKANERIKLLKNYLPLFLIENKKIYGVLSKGIHELSEEECLQYFPVLKEAIIMILEEWAELKRKEKRKERIEAALSEISTNL